MAKLQRARIAPMMANLPMRMVVLVLVDFERVSIFSLYHMRICVI